MNTTQRKIDAIATQPRLAAYSARTLNQLRLVQTPYERGDGLTGLSLKPLLAIFLIAGIAAVAGVQYLKRNERAANVAETPAAPAPVVAKAPAVEPLQVPTEAPPVIRDGVVPPEKTTAEPPAAKPILPVLKTPAPVRTLEAEMRAPAATPEPAPQPVPEVKAAPSAPAPAPAEPSAPPAPEPKA